MLENIELSLSPLMQCGIPPDPPGNGLRRRENGKKKNFFQSVSENEERAQREIWNKKLKKLHFQQTMAALKPTKGPFSAS